MKSRAYSPWYEKAFGKTYPTVYAHRDAAEAQRGLDLAVRMLPDAPGPWLDLGCGQGRHLSQIDARGRICVGLDLSAPLLTLARSDDASARLVRGDMRCLPLGDESCGAVLSLFTAFGYFGPAKAHFPMVSEVARVLAAGGAWFLDFRFSRYSR